MVGFLFQVCFIVLEQDGCLVCLLGSAIHDLRNHDRARLQYNINLHTSASVLT